MHNIRRDLETGSSEPPLLIKCKLNVVHIQPPKIWQNIIIIPMDTILITEEDIVMIFPLCFRQSIFSNYKQEKKVKCLNFSFVRNALLQASLEIVW